MFFRVPEEWLDRSTLDALLAHGGARRAFAQPSALRVPRPFDWDLLQTILAHPSELDVLVTRDGALVDVRTPRSGADVRDLLERGCGVVVRRAQRHHARLAHVAGQIERELSGTVQVQLFVTPRRTRGFSWHYDREDVLILQTLGAKTYHLRQNTVVVDPRAAVDFARYSDERSPLQACTLHAGDLLYLPAGTWHTGRADDGTAFSISIGITPHAWRAT